MTVIGDVAIEVTHWYTGGENASAECLQRDECDFEAGFGLLRDVTLEAKDHALLTGHSVQVERAQFRVVSRVPDDAATLRRMVGR